MITADQLIAHAVGDYLLQSDWMANLKTKKWAPAIAHVLTYSLPFLFLTFSWKVLLFIAGTHLIIDHWRLARYVCWVKNFIAPPFIVYEQNTGLDIPPDALRIKNALAWTWKRRRNPPWAQCTATGYSADRPAWLAVWLLIITDNTMHIICNGLALQWWGR